MNPDTMPELVRAPADILGKPLLLVHWSGASERAVMMTKDEAMMALRHGYTRYMLLPPEAGDAPVQP